MSVDWRDQWARFAPGFREGSLFVSLLTFPGERRRDELRLSPGPGFGDLSHPTTRLTLRLLAPLLKGRHLLDLGSGSGILSLVGYALGAKSVIGIEIDEEALAHARENAALNGFSHGIFFTPPLPTLPLFSEGTLAMNMISSEQEIAWKSLPALEKIRGDLVISGLLASEEEGWLALHLKKGESPSF